jgi:hypothetical protein
MDEGSIDWVTLLVRFAGKCKECESPIPSGSYALWSKKLRAIKHLECRDVRALHKNKDDTSALIEESGTPLTTSNCFICGTRFHLYRSTLEPDYYRSDHSLESICDGCFTDPNVYYNYQQQFLRKVGRFRQRLKSKYPSG